MQYMPQDSRNEHCDNQKKDCVSEARVECLEWTFRHVIPTSLGMLLTMLGTFDFALGTRTAATIPQFGQVNIFAVIRNPISRKLISTRL
jgi:hypothetical protein